jgi:cytochrome oxidase assembly protein ShyY1
MMSPLRTTFAVVAVSAGVAITLALGNWQLRRATEKAAAEQAWERVRRAAPLDLRGASNFGAIAADLPQRVRVRGWFESEHTIWLDNRALKGRAGFLVVTPLRIEASQVRVLVNRGWAPRDPAERTRLPPLRQPDGMVEIEGIAMQGVPRVFQFTRNDFGRIRQNVDIDELRTEIGAPVAGFVIQQTSALDDALDREWISPATGVERHRGYAFQWFSLAALLGVIAIGLAWRLLRRRHAAESAA